MKFDQTSKDLLAAALYTERHASARTRKVPLLHLLDCVSMSLHMGFTPTYGVSTKDATRQRYQNCGTRLFEVVGSDLADFTREGAIDALVAAAYWTVPQREWMAVPLVTELRIEAGMVPNRRGQLYGLAAERIEALEYILREVRKAWMSVPEDAQVPDAINDNALWIAVDRTLA